MNDSYKEMGNEFYSHSGRFSPLFVLTFPIVFIAAIMLAFVYNSLVIYVPIIGYFSVLLTLGYSFALGISAAFCLSLFKVRNIWISRMTGLVCAMIALYIAWVVFVYLFLGKSSSKTEITLIGAILSPHGIWNVACAIAEKGWYSITAFTPAGWVLWTFWIIEALIILTVIVMVAEASTTMVFCETCGKWAENEGGVVNFLPGDDIDLANRFVNKNFSFLQNAVRAKSTETDFFRIDADICETCGELFLVSLLHITKTYDKDESENISEETLVQHLKLSPAEYENLLEMRKILHGAKLQTAGSPEPLEPQGSGNPDPEVVEITDEA